LPLTVVPFDIDHVYRGLETIAGLVGATAGGADVRAPLPPRSRRLPAVA
jgi:hypothetical protein